MPIVGLLYIENLILDTGIAGILTDLLLIESEEEDKAVAFASAGSLINDNSVWILIPENSANDKRTVIMIREWISISEITVDYMGLNAFEFCHMIKKCRPHQF